MLKLLFHDITSVDDTRLDDVCVVNDLILIHIHGLTLNSSDEIVIKGSCYELDTNEVFHDATYAISTMQYFMEESDFELVETNKAMLIVL
jgi:hypothetical protein